MFTTNEESALPNHHAPRSWIPPIHIALANIVSIIILGAALYLGSPECYVDPTFLCFTSLAFRYAVKPYI
jgi:hypothetical protein